MKAVLRGNLLALCASKKKLERIYTSSLTAHLKSLEEKEANTNKNRIRQQIIKVRAEINYKKLYKEATNLGAGYLRKSTILISP